MKRKEVIEAKIKLRAEVSELLGQIAAVSRVPERILNGACALKAAEYKDIVEEAKQKAKCSYQHGTLSDLIVRVEKLKGWLASIT